jgi:type III polyketide synthase
VQLSGKTQIQRRQTILDFTKATTEKDAEPPAVDELSHIFREYGVDLAVSACIKAMEEANVTSTDITHVVAVTCTDQGSPGYDLLVCQKLRLDHSVQRTLLHGVGCAGGLSALRAAADIAAAESRRKRRACVLVVACELCSLFLKAELQAASRDDDLHIAPALFSDAAAAMVVCNDLAVRKDQMLVYELLEWSSMVVPDTVEHMSYAIKADGKLLQLSWKRELTLYHRYGCHHHGRGSQNSRQRDITHV